MRLFEFTELLIESSGGIGRRWLETKAGQNIPFVDKTGAEWELVDVQCFPPNPRLKYDDEGSAKTKNLIKGKDRLLSDVANYVKKVHSGAHFNIIGNIGRAGILVVVRNGNTEYAFLKITVTKRDIGNNPIFWQTSEFAEQTGLVAQTAQMKKAVIPLDPADMIIPGQTYSVDKLISSVSEKILESNVDPKLKNGVTMLLRQVQVGAPKLIADLTEFRPVIEIKLGEIAAPIALATGNMLSGQVKDAENSLLKPLGFNFSSITGISFPSKAEKLIDSFVHLPNGNKIAVSSKDSNGGAKPSTAIIAQTINDKKVEFDKDKNFTKKYKSIVDNIMILDQKSAIEGPLDLAIKFGLITSQERAYLMTIYGKGKITDRKFKAAAPHLYQLYKSSNYSPDTSHVEYQTGYHILAIIARLVVAKMNEKSSILTEFFKAVLNKSDLLQVLAKTSIKGTALCYKEFSIIYPPTFAGKVGVDADSYTSRTKPSRKIAFGFKN
jgi:hypothetical protein